MIVDKASTPAGLLISIYASNYHKPPSDSKDIASGTQDTTLTLALA